MVDRGSMGAPAENVRARRWEIGVLVGPCSFDEAEGLLMELYEASAGRLGAVVTIGEWDEGRPSLWRRIRGRVPEWPKGAAC